MKVYYDREVDALYITFGSQKPDGVTEASEGINLDTTSEGRIVGIEILDASKRVDLKTILSYELELDKENRESLLNAEDIAVETGISDLAEHHDHYLYGVPKKDE